MIRRWSAALAKFVWDLTACAVKHDIASLAAVIAFYAFFSLFPLLLLTLYVASALLPHADAEQLLVTLIRPYFPALPEAKQFIDRNIAHLSAVGSNVGLVSAVTLTWSATSGFLAVQQAMDVILASSQARSYMARRFIAFAMLAVFLCLTIASAVAMELYPVVGHTWFARARVPHLALLAHALSRVLFPLSLFLSFVVFYRYLPSAPVPWTCVVPGACVATAAVDLGRALFAWYASHLMAYQMVYGSLAVVMLVVLWIYIASMVMLFGAEIAAVLRAWEQGAAGG
ncbi:hypothetical protein GCM10010885_22200 [Alicyclobacillus cellulosilyticus]|uniref:YihY family inner membrane protein n=1 Tax=Alicyclobacillus cellulosilyticus TaxID=1003997 RepID=A0A917KFP1_9BACL|nr:YihY/virulence factor BrkB family protein [Alicyclobacillus cellulosilyticus]GGJ12382.1 hypothetical protein GCM10010885_22200 [Alicyclobacillus cellulosilyticus]